MRVFASLPVLGMLLLCPAVVWADGPDGVLLEAEAFETLGGWVVDQQFMDQMGSPFLLAHGLGNPVLDATTTVTLPGPGAYRLWVRTRDWVAPWKTPETPEAKRAVGTPGRFQIILDGVPVDTTFGVVGADWHWQDGGTIDVAEAEIHVALHDLTGFEGRCDAVFFSQNLDNPPPNADPAMKTWRRGLLSLPDEPVDAGAFDLVVVGGGTAGMCATLQAARLGVTVALIQDRPVVGGNNSSDVRVWLNGNTNFEPYPDIGNIMKEFEPAQRAHAGPGNTAEIYEDQKRINILESCENVTLFLNFRANDVETQDGRIVAVVAENIRTAQRLRFTGRTFADCTGDGCVGALVDADFDMTVDGHMGRCNLWNIINTGSACPFPQCPWALNLSSRPFPEGEAQLGVWYWESGFYHDPFEKSEYIRDWNFRAMYGAWDALKNVKNKFSTYKLNWAAHISGKRESRRLLGDVILTEEDFVEWVEYPDAAVPCTWSIDLHLPNPAYQSGWEGDEFISKAYYTQYTKPYWIPYRCLYSRNIDNLFMAGRDISVTHEALGAVRVMRTGGMMGEVVGIAASLCKEHDTTPRGVYADHLAELQRRMGRTLVVRWLETIGPNAGPDAVVTVSSNYDTDRYPQDNINDGRVDTRDNSLRWLSNGSSMPDVVTFRWAEPRLISAMRLVSGWFNGSTTTDPIVDFYVEYHNGSAWKAVPGAGVEDNTRIECLLKFDPVQTDRLRVVVTETPMDISRIWEVGFYHPTADLDSDGQVDLGDLTVLAAEWLDTQPGLSADLFGEPIVDMLDWGVLSAFWRWP